MELHEYQAKSLLTRFGVPSPPYILLEVESDIENAISKFGVQPLLVKAQVHGMVGGERGGVIAVGRPKELSEAINKLLGSKIVTSESGPDGFTASKVLVMSAPAIVRQFQLKISLTSKGDIGITVCQEGGKLFTEHPFEGLIRSFQENRLAAALGIRGANALHFKKVLEGALRAFLYLDALLIEIDPLVVTENGIFQAQDVRMVIDDYALFRQPEILHMKDISQVGPRTRIPPYVCLEMGGQIGCLSNGVGLCLATADLIRLFDGIPGKVVNVGSELSEDSLVEGLRMLQKERYRVLFVNLFTGIVDGEHIARVLKQEVTDVPMVVRLEGTHATGGRLLLQGLDPQCVATGSLDEAAACAVRLAGEERGSVES